MKIILNAISNIWNSYKFFVIILILALVVASMLLSFSKQELPLILGTILASVTASLFAVILDMALKDRAKKRSIEYLVHDQYESYSYAGDPNTSTTLNSESNKHISCRIIYGESSDLEMFVEGSDANSKEWFEWQGFITMKSKNTGEIAYRI